MICPPRRRRLWSARWWWDYWRELEEAARLRRRRRLLERRRLYWLLLLAEAWRRLGYELVKLGLILAGRWHEPAPLAAPPPRSRSRPVTKLRAALAARSYVEWRIRGGRGPVPDDAASVPPAVRAWADAAGYDALSRAWDRLSSYARGARLAAAWADELVAIQPDPSGSDGSDPAPRPGRSRRARRGPG
jgi:hypothetical protein